jgi:DNA-directed RNA polymerase subunit RPC12/RpoP
MEAKWIKPFIGFAGGILLAAALFRFVIAAGNTQALALPEPMLGIPLLYAVLMVGGLELTAALICLFGKRVRLQAGLLAWLATNFVVFWIGLFWINCHPQATCIGSLTDPFHLSRGTTGFVTQLLPLGLLLGSYAAVFQLWMAKKGRFEGGTVQTATVQHGADRSGSDVLVRFLKISCISCGGHVEFPTNRLGEKIPCPHCRTIITLKRPENIKISCAACDGHIEFPIHGLGQKIPCPHCKTDIILNEPI